MEMSLAILGVPEMVSGSGCWPQGESGVGPSWTKGKPGTRSYCSRLRLRLGLRRFVGVTTFCHFFQIFAEHFMPYPVPLFELGIAQKEV